jgi:hypothetical protein
MARARKSRRSVRLPWEGRTGRLAGVVLDRRRVVTGAGVAAAGLLLFAVYRKADERERIRTTRAALAEIRRAVVRFRDEIGRCPRSTGELLHPPRSGVRYLAELPTDGWGRAIYVRCPGEMSPDGIDVVSAGADGDFFGEDNVM